MQEGAQLLPGPADARPPCPRTGRPRHPGAPTRHEPESQIVKFTTDTATLEWAVPTKKLKAALERVQSSWSSEAPSAHTIPSFEHPSANVLNSACPVVPTVPVAERPADAVGLWN